MLKEPMLEEESGYCPVNSSKENPVRRSEAPVLYVNQI